MYINTQIMHHNVVFTCTTLGNTGQVMFSGEIYYNWPFNSSEKVDKIVGKTSFFFA